MDSQDNRYRLFLGSCFALITTAFTFSIRAGILDQLGAEFTLTNEQLGFINSMWFLGFPISMIIFGIFYHTIGPKLFEYEQSPDRLHHREPSILSMYLELLYFRDLCFDITRG